MNKCSCITTRSTETPQDPDDSRVPFVRERNTTVITTYHRYTLSLGHCRLVTGLHQSLPLGTSLSRNCFLLTLIPELAHDIQQPVEAGNVHYNGRVSVYVNRYSCLRRTKQKKTETRETVYVYPNIEALSRNHCCGGKAISITYFECVSVARVMQHEKRMRRIIL